MLMNIGYNSIIESGYFWHIFEVKKSLWKNLSAASTVLQGVKNLLKKQVHFGSIPGGIISTIFLWYLWPRSFL